MRRLRGVLNKVTVQNFSSLSANAVALFKVDDYQILKASIDMIVDGVMDDTTSTYSEAYAKFCINFSKLSVSQDGASFEAGKLLTNKCRRVVEAEVASPKRCRGFLGFVAHLFILDLLPTELVRTYLTSCLQVRELPEADGARRAEAGVKSSVDDIDACLWLLGRVGPELDKADPAFMEDCILNLQRLLNNTIMDKCRHMKILNLLDQRKSDWTKKKSHEEMEKLAILNLYQSEEQKMKYLVVREHGPSNRDDKKNPVKKNLPLQILCAIEKFLQDRNRKALTVFTAKTLDCASRYLVVQLAICRSLEMSAWYRWAVVDMLKDSCKRKLLQAEDIRDGLRQVLRAVRDMDVDVPQAFSYLQEIAFKGRLLELLDVETDRKALENALR